MPLAFEGFQEEGFVGFDDARFMRCPMPSRVFQKAVPPQKGRVLVDLASTCGITHADALNQGLRKTLPLFALAQMRQGGSGQ